MPSCIASSFSHGLAFISSKPERTITFTSSPPRRRDERQQSMAVLPPPSTITRRPIFVTWPKDTDESQSMPMWMLAAASRAAGDVEVAPARRARADEDRVEALGEQRLQRIDAMAALELDAEVEDVAHLLVDHALGQAELRDLAADHAAGEAVGIEHGDVVAERRQVARDGERRGTRADARDALAVLARGLLRQALA